MNHVNQAKINRYLELQQSIKESEKELSELKAEFVAGGNGESESNYLVIKDNFRESVASKKVFEEKLGVNWLKENNLITLSVFNTIVITAKNKNERAA